MATTSSSNGQEGRPRGTSIRARVTWLVVGAALLSGAVAGLAGAWAAGHAVNRQFTEDAAHNAARLVDALRLPHSPRLATELAGIFGGEVVFVAEDGRLMATSLDQDLVGPFLSFLAGASRPDVIRLAGRDYRPAVATLYSPCICQLWLLTPESRLRQARWRAAWPIVLAILPTLLLAVLVGSRVTRATVQPLARLGDEFEALSARLSNGGEWGIDPAPAVGARAEPAEVARLADAFHSLVSDLRAARVRLAESARLAAVGKLSASVAHELRNPLAGIRMNAQVLAQALAREGREDPSLTLIIKEADRLSLRLEELLGLATGSRPASRTDARAETVPLSRVRDALVALLGSQFRQANVELRCAGDFTAQASGSADEVRRILLNLLLNALEASAPGQMVELRADQAEPWATLTVTDQGGGIDPAVGDIFAAFVTSKPHGVGLGLAISRELAERNGGHLVGRNLDGGAQFVLSVPLAPPSLPQRGPDL